MEVKNNEEDLIAISLQKVLDTLENKQPKINKKLHRNFLSLEQENAAFLISRVVRFNPTYSPYLMKALLICKTSHRQDPTFWLARDMLHTVTKLPSTNIQAKPSVSSYPEEFPQAILDGDLVVATRVLVAEALASWSFFNKDSEKIHEIIKVGLKRWEQIHKKRLSFANKKKLNEESQFMIYFTTHLVLVATMWGEIKWESVPHNLITKLIEWTSILEPVRNQNLEIYLELLFCLKLLGQLPNVPENMQKTFWKNQETIILEPHESYHVYVLWALFLISIQS